MRLLEGKSGIKGMASWIWVIGSVIFGLIIFYAGYTLIGSMMKTGADEMLQSELSDLHAALRRSCVSEGAGSRTTHEISIPERVKAVYIAKSNRSPPPDKVSTLISDRETSAGNYLCYQLMSGESNLPKRCWELPCEINMTYVGTPTLKVTLATRLAYLMGERNIFSYRYTITKTGEKKVIALAEPVIK
jgi:hypothetical protein